MPGVLAVIGPPGNRRAVAECASCGRAKPVRGRGLCGGCKTRHRRDGTIKGYGWVKADRLAELAALPPLHDGPENVPPPGYITAAQAAERLGVSRRTIERYKRDMEAS